MEANLFGTPGQTAGIVGGGIDRLNTSSGGRFGLRKIGIWEPEVLLITGRGKVKASILNITLSGNRSPQENL